MGGGKDKGDEGGWLAPATLTVAAGLLAAAVTAAVAFTPYVDFGYRRPSLHLVLDTADAFIALLLAYLLWGRHSRIGRLQDALFADGLLLLGLAGLGLTVLVSQAEGVLHPALGVWLPLLLRLVGALLIAAAACAAGRPMPLRLRRATRLLPWVTILLGFLLVWLLRDVLPEAVEARPGAADSTPVLEGHPALLTAHAVSALAFLLAAVLFARQAARRADPLLVWLGPAFVLAAFGRLNYLLFPSMYSGWLYTGDLLRTASYAVLLVGAGREIQQYWSAQSRAAVLEDRRRLARELHDGVVQELGYIRSELLGARAQLPVAQRILEACDRGLDEARGAVDALGSESDEPLGYVLHRAARQVAERYGANVVVEVDDAVEADQNQRHALVRITREAVSNAVRHGQAHCTRIKLTRDGSQRILDVSDDGQGFPVGNGVTDRRGYGLISMRERAQALPGSFELDSEPGKGTRVVVSW